MVIKNQLIENFQQIIHTLLNKIVFIQHLKIERGTTHLLGGEGEELYNPTVATKMASPFVTTLHTKEEHRAGFL